MNFIEQNVRSQLQEYGIPVHTHDGICRYLLLHVEPGEFLKAIFSNQFMEAFQYADAVNRANLMNYAQWLYCAMPMRTIEGGPWGSAQAVQRWVDIGAAELEGTPV